MVRDYIQHLTTRLLREAYYQDANNTSYNANKEYVRVSIMSEIKRNFDFVLTKKWGG